MQSDSDLFYASFSETSLSTAPTVDEIVNPCLSTPLHSSDTPKDAMPPQKHFLFKEVKFCSKAKTISSPNFTHTNSLSPKHVPLRSPKASPQLFSPIDSISSEAMGSPSASDSIFLSSILTEIEANVDDEKQFSPRINEKKLSPRTQLLIQHQNSLNESETPISQFQIFRNLTPEQQNKIKEIEKRSNTPSKELIMSGTIFIIFFVRNKIRFFLFCPREVFFFASGKPCQISDPGVAS